MLVPLFVIVMFSAGVVEFDVLITGVVPVVFVAFVVELLALCSVRGAGLSVTIFFKAPFVTFKPLTTLSIDVSFFLV
jgi:hypothetical protein